MTKESNCEDSAKHDYSKDVVSQEPLLQKVLIVNNYFKILLTALVKAN